LRSLLGGGNDKIAYRAALDFGGAADNGEGIAGNTGLQARSSIGSRGHRITPALEDNLNVRRFTVHVNFHNLAAS
jgi:hypothetical protein